MNARTASTIVVLGALTGMRSMAGVTTVAFSQRRGAAPLLGLAAVAEMIADKTSLVGDRTDPVALAGRATMGAVVGAMVARQHGHDVLLGGVLGTVTAIVAAHLACRARKALPGSGVASGVLEDGLVLAVASRYASGTR